MSLTFATSHGESRLPGNDLHPSGLRRVSGTRLLEDRGERVSIAGHAALLDSTRRLFLLGGVSDANVTPDPVVYNPE